MSVMLYAHPGSYNIEGEKFAYVVVDKERVAKMLEEGWCKTTTEALKKSKSKNAKTKRRTSKPKE